MCLHWCLPWGFFFVVGYAGMRIFSWPWSWFSFWQRYGLFETAFHGLSDYRSMFFSWCSHVSPSGIVVWEVNFLEQQQQQTATTAIAAATNWLVLCSSLPPTFWCWLKGHSLIPTWLRAVVAVWSFQEAFVFGAHCGSPITLFNPLLSWRAEKLI